MTIFGKMYSIQYDISTLLKKDKKRLQKDITGAIKVQNIIEGLLMNPFSSTLDVRGLAPKGSNRFRLRVGDYRVIYSIDSGNKIVLIHRIGLRKDIYK